MQTYYALYGAFQALHVADGSDRPTDHNATQKLFVDKWCMRRFHLPPWTIAHGDPTAAGFDSHGFRGIKRDLIRPGEAHAWAYTWQGDDALHVVGQALQGTRARKIADALDRARHEKLRDEKKRWHAEEDARVAAGKKARKRPLWPEKRNLNAAEKAQVEQAVRPVSIMDYLYRLRIKSNYLDAQMYRDGPGSDADAKEFLHDLVVITAANMLVHELRLARMLAPGQLEHEMDAWLARNRRGRPDGSLSVRRGLVAAYA